MGFRGREIESKLIIPDIHFQGLCMTLDELLADQQPIVRYGSSVDTYWPVHDGRVDADFLRVRERDGIRQITVKGKDKGHNLNRIEIDIDSTSETHKIHRLVRCLLGKPAGVIAKTYQVWELDSEYDTVCAYQVTTPRFQPMIVEVEARTEERMLELEALVREKFKGYGIVRSPGSLFELFITKEKQF